MPSARMLCAMSASGLLVFQVSANAAPPRAPHEGIAPRPAVAATPLAIHAPAMHTTVPGTAAVHLIAVVGRTGSSGPAVVGGPTPSRIANRSGISGTPVRPRSR